VTRWAGHAEGAGEIIGCKVLSGKLKGSRPHGRHRCRWKDNIEINITGKVFMIMWRRLIKFKTL
jgi:hypothetical protein